MFLSEGPQTVSGIEVLLAIHVPIPICASDQFFMCFLKGPPSPVIIEGK